MIEDLTKLVTRKSFIECAYQEKRERLRVGGNSSDPAVFEYLNDLREETFGEPCFPSFDAFRKYRDRTYLKKDHK